MYKDFVDVGAWLIWKKFLIPDTSFKPFLIILLILSYT